MFPHNGNLPAGSSSNSSNNPTAPAPNSNTPAPNSNAPLGQLPTSGNPFFDQYMAMMAAQQAHTGQLSALPFIPNPALMPFAMGNPMLASYLSPQEAFITPQAPATGPGVAAGLQQSLGPPLPAQPPGRTAAVDHLRQLGIAPPITLPTGLPTSQNPPAPPNPASQPATPSLPNPYAQFGISQPPLLNPNQQFYQASLQATLAPQNPPPAPSTSTLPLPTQMQGLGLALRTASTPTAANPVPQVTVASTPQTQPFLVSSSTALERGRFNSKNRKPFGKSKKAKALQSSASAIQLKPGAAWPGATFYLLPDPSDVVVRKNTIAAMRECGLVQCPLLYTNQDSSQVYETIVGAFKPSGINLVMLGFRYFRRTQADGPLLGPAGLDAQANMPSCKALKKVYNHGAGIWLVLNKKLDGHPFFAKLRKLNGESASGSEESDGEGEYSDSEFESEEALGEPNPMERYTCLMCEEEIPVLAKERHEGPCRANMKKPVGKKCKTLFISDSEEEASAPQERPCPKTANPFTAGPTKSPYLSTPPVEAAAPPRQDKKLKRMTSTVNTDTSEQQHATTLSGPASGALVPVQDADDQFYDHFSHFFLPDGLGVLRKCLNSRKPLAQRLYPIVEFNVTHKDMWQPVHDGDGFSLAKMDVPRSSTLQVCKDPIGALWHLRFHLAKFKGRSKPFILVSISEPAVARMLPTSTVCSAAHLQLSKSCELFRMSENFKFFADEASTLGVNIHSISFPSVSVLSGNTPEAIPFWFSVFDELEDLPEPLSLYCNLQYQGDEDNNLGQTLHAFSHWLHYQSSRTSVFTQFAGRTMPDGEFMLIDFVQHMAEYSLSEKDIRLPNGYQPAVSEWEILHCCNDVCRALGLDTKIFDRSGTAWAMTYEEIAVEKDNAREDRPVYDNMDVDYHPRTVSSNYDREAED